MNNRPGQITLQQWQQRYDDLKSQGLAEPSYGGPLGRYISDGDFRLRKLMFDNSPAALRLWNFLLTEEQRLGNWRKLGKKIVGTMKDLGTIPVMVYSLDNLIAFYPDGAWWIPCVMEQSAGLLNIADSLGIDESFCPVRAMLGAFITEKHFPIPDLLTCSVGATCDDFSAIAQRIEALGHKILWWEIPHRRLPETGENAVNLPGGFCCPQSQLDFVKDQLEIIKIALERLSGQKLDNDKLALGIKKSNRVRRCLSELRTAVFTAEPCPMPALEMLIAEMLAIHFCSDLDETINVLTELLDEVKKRIRQGDGILKPNAARIFWVNPVADLRVMNLLESCDGRICGTEYLFTHAIDAIPENIRSLEALAQMALADPMAGSAVDRAKRIAADIKTFGAEALIISRIPGASHCALEGKIIAEFIQNTLDVPILEIEVPPLTDAIEPSLRTRFEALSETVKQRRKK